MDRVIIKDEYTFDSKEAAMKYIGETFGLTEEKLLCDGYSDQTGWTHYNSRKEEHDDQEYEYWFKENLEENKFVFTLKEVELF